MTTHHRNLQRSIMVRGSKVIVKLVHNTNYIYCPTYRIRDYNTGSWTYAARNWFPRSPRTQLKFIRLVARILNPSEMV